MIYTQNINDTSQHFFDEVIKHKVWQRVLKEFGLTLSFNHYSQNYYGLDLKAQVRLVIRQLSIAINPKILTLIYRYNTARYHQE